MRGTFSIRLAEPDDAAAVTAVLKASYPELMGPAYDPQLLQRALPFMARAHPILLASGTYYVAQAESTLVGCGGWSFEKPGTEEKTSGVGHVRHFATAPAWTGRGVARSIYAKCQEQARAAGVTRFECYSTLNGELFYAALGFSRIQQTEIPMGPDVMLPAIHMSRLI